MSGRPLLIVESATQIHYYEPKTATVWISHSNTWNRVADPIFHRREDWRMLAPESLDDGRDRRGWRVETTCGSLISSASWLQTPGQHDSADYRSSDNGLLLPIRWALRFARPCRRCWP